MTPTMTEPVVILLTWPDDGFPEYAVICRGTDMPCPPGS